MSLNNDGNDNVRTFRLYNGNVAEMTRNPDRGFWGVDENNSGPWFASHCPLCTLDNLLGKREENVRTWDLEDRRYKAFQEMAWSLLTLPGVAISAGHWPGIYGYSQQYSGHVEASNAFYDRLQAVHDLLKITEAERAALETLEHSRSVMFLGHEHWVCRDFLVGSRSAVNGHQLQKLYRTYGIGRAELAEELGITAVRTQNLKDNDEDLGLWLDTLEDTRRFLVAMHDRAVSAEIDHLLRMGTARIWPVEVKEYESKKESEDEVMRKFKSDKAVVLDWARCEGACIEGMALLDEWEEKWPLEWWYATLGESDKRTADSFLCQHAESSELRSFLRGSGDPTPPWNMPWKAVREDLGLAPWPKLPKRIREMEVNLEPHTGSETSQRSEYFEFLGRKDTYIRVPRYTNTGLTAHVGSSGGVRLIEGMLGADPGAFNSRTPEMETWVSLLDPDLRFTDCNNEAYYCFGRHPISEKGKKSLLKVMRLAWHIHQHRTQVEGAAVAATEAVAATPVEVETRSPDEVYVNDPEVQKKYPGAIYTQMRGEEGVQAIELGHISTSKGHYRIIKLHDVEPVLFHWFCHLNDRDAFPFSITTGITRTPRERAILQMMLKEALRKEMFSNTAEGLVVPETPGIICELHHWETAFATDKSIGDAMIWVLAETVDRFINLGK